MAIKRPDEYQHNNPNNAIADSDFVRGGNRVVADTTALYALSSKIDQLKQNATRVFVISLGYWMRLIDINNINNSTGWIADTDPNINPAPFGLKNQIQFLSNDNTNKYKADDIVLVGKFIKTDDEFDRAAASFESFEEIFSTWPRFSHSTGSGLPANPSNTNAWSYNPTLNQIESTVNALTLTGFYSSSDKRYDTYSHFATVTSTAGDNDRIGLVIAFVEDQPQFEGDTSYLVQNNAYGLDPSSFDWDINTTDEFIPNQHTITVLRNREQSTLTYVVWYDFGKSSQKVIANGTSSLTYNPVTNWSGAEVDIEVIREENIITTRTTEFSDAPGGKGSLGHLLTIDLDSDPLLNKFKGPTSYGYCQNSQTASTFKNVAFSNSNNIIYDLRDGSVWIANSAGTYMQDTSRNYYNEIGIRRVVFNPLEKTLIYIKENKELEILNDSGVTNTFTNGLTETGTVVKLGGTLTENTNIFNFDGKTLNLGFADSQTTPTVSTIQTITQSQNNITAFDQVNNKTNQLSVTPTSIYLNHTEATGPGATGNQAIGVDSSGIGVRDDINQRGITNSGDYEINFVARSLVTKQYVDQYKRTFKTVPYPTDFQFRPFEIYEKDGEYIPSISVKDFAIAKYRNMKKYYVDYINGLNTNDGLTALTPVKTVAYAYTTLGARLIYLAPGLHRADSWGILSNSTTNDDLFIIGSPGTIVSKATNNSVTWTSVSGTIYSSTVSNCMDVIDYSRLDNYGYPLLLTRKATQAEMLATPDSIWISGSNLQINLNRVPDSNCLVVLNNQVNSYRGNNSYLYIENVTFMGGTRAFNLQNNTGTSSTLIGLFKNCRFIHGGASPTDNTVGEGLRTSNALLTWAEDCIAYNNRRDGFNYRKESGGKVTHQCYAIETNCQSFLNGGGIDTSTSVNASSAHDAFITLRLNCKGYSNVGPNFIDVEGAYTWNVNCEAWDSRGFNNPASPYPNWGDFIVANTTGNGLVGKMFITNCRSYDNRISYGTNADSLVYVDLDSRKESPTLGAVTIGAIPSNGNASTFSFPVFSSYVPATTGGGSGTVTSVSGTSYLTVTNPTTTPALAIVQLPIVNGGTNSTTTLTNNKVMVSTTGAIVESTITSTELGYLSGVTSNIQTQLNAKGAGTVTQFNFTNGGGFTGVVTNATSTPTLALTLQDASVSQSGQVNTSSQTFTGAKTIQTNNLLSTNTFGLSLDNITNATSGTQQNSPMLSIVGTGYATTPATSMLVQGLIGIVPSAGTTAPSGTIVFRTSINGTTTTPLTIASNGNIGISGLTASQAVFTDASKNLVSNTITGTGNVMMSASPTTTGTLTAAAITASGNIAGAAGTFSAAITQNSSGLATATNIRVLFNNTTAATVGTPIQYSPTMSLQGNAWNTGTSASNQVDFGVWNSPVSGSPASAILNIGYRNQTVGGTTYANIFNIKSSGDTTITGGYTAQTFLSLKNYSSTLAALSGSIAMYNDISFNGNGGLYIANSSASGGDYAFYSTSGSNVARFLNSNTGLRTYTLPDNTGTIALISDLATPVVEVTGTSQSASVNTKYIANNAALVTITLPTTVAQGQQILIRGKGAGGWRLSQNSGQTIHGASDSTTGTGGYIASQSRYDTVALECITANTDFIIISNRGTLTIV